MVHKEDLLEMFITYDLEDLYGDFSDDGDGKLELTEKGNEVATTLIKLVEQELSKAREEGRKEKDIASDFLYWHPLGGGMPDSSIRIGVEFEVGGCYEDWGFVIEQYGKTISSGRTLKEAMSKLTTK